MLEWKWSYFFDFPMFKAFFRDVLNSSILFFSSPFFDETLTLITFLVVEQMIFYCCQKETYHWKVHVKLDWKMVLGESLTSKIYLLWMLQYWLVPWWDWKKGPKIGIKKSCIVSFSIMVPSKTSNYCWFYLLHIWKLKWYNPGTFYMFL